LTKTAPLSGDSRSAALLGLFRGPDGNFAPIPAVPAPTIGWPKSTHNGRSLRLTLSICLPLLFEIQ
jgi:hypothetical protein